MKLVSAIMPTKGRQEFARMALDCFLSQDYPKKELVILDDIGEPSFGATYILRVMSKNPNVRYSRIQDGTIPYKRNRCCATANGEIITHFDSDDWSAPDRITDQVNRLGAYPMTGYDSILFYDVAKTVAYKYRGIRNNYAVGTSLMYLRSWWEKHPFPLINDDESQKLGRDVPLLYGEDNALVRIAQLSRQLITADAGKRMVARVHAGNTCEKDIRVTSSSYMSVNVVQLPGGFLQCEPVH